MLPVMAALPAFLGALFRSRGSLTLHVLALQHQFAVYQQTVHHPRGSVRLIASSGRGCRACGPAGKLPWHSSSRAPCLPGSRDDSVTIGDASASGIVNLT